MSKMLIVVLALAVGLAVGGVLGSRMTSGVEAETARAGTAFSAVPDAIGRTSPARTK